MHKYTKYVLTLLRLGFGWLFLYSGITKILNPEWSAQGYILGAKSLSSLYAWLGSSANIEWVNMLTQWGMVAIGAALILGFFTRLAASLGALMMLLFYFPVLAFPYAGEHSYIVDDHIIYALSLLLLATMDAGKYWGIDKKRYNKKK